jgi:hypothetical protein
MVFNRCDRARDTTTRRAQLSFLNSRGPTLASNGLNIPRPVASPLSPFLTFHQLHEAKPILVTPHPSHLPRAHRGLLEELPEDRLAGSQACLCRLTGFMSTRPTPAHHSAIYFGVVNAKPRFVWLHFPYGRNHPDTDKLAKLGISKKRLDAKELLLLASNSILERPLEAHLIGISLPEVEELCPYCTPDLENKASLSPIDRELSELFCGPIIAWALSDQAHSEASIQKHVNQSRSGTLRLSPCHRPAEG